jgi:hypothetical protein
MTIDHIKYNWPPVTLKLLAAEERTGQYICRSEGAPSDDAILGSIWRTSFGSMKFTDKTYIISVEYLLMKIDFYDSLV